MPFTAGAPPGHGSRPGKHSLLADPWKKPWQYTYLDGERETRGHAPDALTWRTPEGIEVKPLYTAADLEGLEHLDSMPGFPPFVRGPRARMYAGRPWTLRQYADYSTAEESNAFYRKNLAAGQTPCTIAVHPA